VIPEDVSDGRVTLLLALRRKPRPGMLIGRRDLKPTVPSRTNTEDAALDEPEGSRA